MFKETHPILGTRDIQRGIAFYTRRLGFQLAFGDKADPPNYVGFRRDAVELHMQFQFEHEMGTIRLRFLVEDPDARFNEYALFLFTTALTSVTGFLFPIHGFTPALDVGILACVILAVTLFALYKGHLVDAWRWIYVITAVASLYLNVFVLVVQSFVKVSALNALAPTQTEPPFAITQAAVLAIFILIALIGVVKFRPPKAQM